MATLEALAAQLQALQGELQQQHNRMQVVEAENAQLRANGLGALPQLIQALQSETQTQQRLPSLVDTKGIGTFAVYGEGMRVVLTWGAEQDTEIAEAD
eukprot:2091555-Amphidinium_carterae.1